jgi:hypothetical protein
MALRFGRFSRPNEAVVDSLAWTVGVLIGDADAAHRQNPGNGMTRLMDGNILPCIKIHIAASNDQFAAKITFFPCSFELAV